MTCPCCGGDCAPVVRHPVGSWTMWHCNSCHAYPVTSKDGTVIPHEQYGRDYFERTVTPEKGSYSGYISYDRHRDAMRKDFAAALRPFINSGSRVLDIGCATGTALEAAKSLGVEERNLSGIDISSYAIDVARQHLPNARLTQADGLDAELGGSCDVVMLWDVLEHVSNPFALLSSAVRALAPGGRLLISTPDPESFVRRVTGWRWSEFRPGEHQCFVSRCWFAWAAARSGLRVVSWERSGKHVTLEHAVSRLRAYLPWIPETRSQRIVWLTSFDQQRIVLERI